MRRKNKKSKLQFKFLMGLVFLDVVLTIVLSIIIGASFHKNMEERYTKTAFDAATIGGALIDGDTIERYAKTLETDAYYESVSESLLQIKQTMGLEYFYVVIPYEEEMLYIWDVGTEEEDGICAIGTWEEYYKEEKEVKREAFSNPGERVFLITDDGDEYGYLASVHVPIMDSSGKVVALSCVDISMNMVNKQIYLFVVIISLIIGGILLIFIVGYFVLIKKSILQPISQLNKATEDVTSQHLEALETFCIEIKTKDELEDLANSFTDMVHELHKYINNLTAITAEKERIGAELDLANHIQRSMLPCIFPAFPGRPELDIYAMMKPAKEVGGDFYDFFLVDDNRLALVMADVSGKGISAALFMVIAKTLIKNVVQAGFSPKAVLEKVNDQLCINNDAEMFVTVWLGILEISTGKLTAVNAGHEYPVLKRKNKEYELLKDHHGFVLAGMEGTRYKEYELQINPGDRLFLYTDGVAEATNANFELYGTQQMVDTLNSNKEVSCEEILNKVKDNIDAFVGQAPQFDDITMLTLELREPNF